MEKRVRILIKSYIIIRDRNRSFFAKGTKMKLSQNQKLILGILTIVVVGLCASGLGLFYITYGPQLVFDDQVTPTGIVSSSPTFISFPSQAECVNDLRQLISEFSEYWLCVG
jgi:hypothetical protein